MPGLAEFLSRTADVPRAIVTLMGPRAMDEVCDRFEIDIDVRVARRPGVRPKPAPDQVEVACDELEADPATTVMIGDSTWDAGAARAAGVGFVGLTNGRPSEFTDDTALAADLGDAATSIGL